MRCKFDRFGDADGAALVDCCCQECPPAFGMKVVWTIAIKMRNALIGSFVVALRWHRALTAAGKAKVSLD